MALRSTGARWVGWAAHTGGLSWPPVALYAAGIVWTLFYDTIYAHQDKEDDALIGVKSTARLFGAATAKWLFAFLALTVSLLAIAVIGALAPAGEPGALVIVLAGCWGVGWHLAWQMRQLKIDDPATCLRLFRANRETGLILVLALALAIGFSGVT